MQTAMMQQRFDQGRAQVRPASRRTSLPVQRWGPSGPSSPALARLRQPPLLCPLPVPQFERLATTVLDSEVECPTIKLP